MPRTYRISVAGATVSQPFHPSFYEHPFHIGIGVTTNSTSTTYSVQHSFDPVFNHVFSSTVAVIPASAAVWFNNTGMSSLSSNADGNIAFPVVAIRLNVSAAAGSSVITQMVLSQAG
jgi:hypothetical protein